MTLDRGIAISAVEPSDRQPLITHRAGREYWVHWPSSPPVNRINAGLLYGIRRQGDDCDPLGSQTDKKSVGDPYSIILTSNPLY